MRLLICTQAVDENDPALGFFTRWIEELAKKCESVTVVCLTKGKHSLPSNVRVFSLGKENGRAGRATYAMRFLCAVWREKERYDAVFVHMNQEYVLLAGLLWKMLGKRVFLWRNHYAGSFLTQVAGFFCTKVFYTSASSYTARFGNAMQMPVGVDASIFFDTGGDTRVPGSVLFLGRIAPSKHPDTLIEASGLLAAEGGVRTVTICGPVAPCDRMYAENLREEIRSRGLGEVVAMRAPVPHRETPALYLAHDIFVDLSRSGMYNKTLFEAALCGCRIVATSADFALINDPRYFLKDASAEALTKALRCAIAIPAHEANLTAQKAQSNALRHTLTTLIDTLVKEFARHSI